MRKAKKVTLNCYPEDKIKMRTIAGNIGILAFRDTEADILHKILDYCEVKK